MQTIRNMKASHIAAQLTAHILAPDPEKTNKQRLVTLLGITTDGEPSARTSIVAVAYAGYLLSRHINAQEVEHSVDDIISEMTVADDAPITHDIGIGFARRALDPADDDSAATAVNFVVSALEGDEYDGDDGQHFLTSLANVMGIALTFYQAYSSPW